MLNLYELFYGDHGRRREARPEGPRPTGPRLLWWVLKRHCWTLIKLNILFWLLCLPLVTIPAALKAMTRVELELLRGEHCDLWPDFWGAFKEGFLRTTLVGLLAAGLLAAMGTGIWFYGTAMRENGLFAAPVLLLVVAVLVLAMSLPSLCSLLVCTGLKLGEALRSAVLLTLVRLPQNLGALGVNLALLAVYWLGYPYTAVLLPAILLSLGWLTACYAAWPGLTKYVFREETPACAA